MVASYLAKYQILTIATSNFTAHHNKNATATIIYNTLQGFYLKFNHHICTITTIVALYNQISPLRYLHQLLVQKINH